MNTAQIVLLQLLKNWYNYPFCEGIEWVNSIFTDDAVDLPDGLIVNKEQIKKTSSNDEKDDDNVQENLNADLGNDLKNYDLKPMLYDDYSEIFAFNEGTIITFHDLPIKGEKSRVRVILRDITGKYVWDFEKLDFPLNNNQPNHFEEDFDPKNYCKKIINDQQINYSREPKEIPTFSNLFNSMNENKNMDENTNIEKNQMNNINSNEKKEQKKYESINMLSEMIDYIGETFEGGNDINYNLPSKNVTSNEEEQNSLNELAKIYKKQNDNLTKHLKEEKQQIIPNIKEQQSKIKKRTNHWHMSRLLISHLGLLTMKSPQELLPLKRNQRLDRSIKEIDRRPSRELIKIGVIYVAPGQTGQYEILANEFGSPAFEEFVNSLGWEIDLLNHKGYSGGLDTYNKTNGETAPYFANFESEVLFHVSTRMPNSKTDQKQIHKKRHIGNDITQIIWSENEDHDYNPETIVSQFNFAHIVIYPMTNGLYRIQIFMKPNVKFFGPLMDGMIINKQSLPYLVRQTAMLANKIIRYNQKGYQHPFPNRWSILTQTIDRYKLQLPFDKYFTKLMLAINNESLEN